MSEINATTFPADSESARDVCKKVTRDPLDLSVAMVNWNGLEVTTAALASLRQHTVGIGYEVFLVDNGSTRDASAVELPRRFPWVRFFANAENLGFTKANNQAIRQAKGRYVLLLNNDTIQTGNALGQAIQYMDAHPEVGALGIEHRNNDQDQSFQPSFYWFPRPLSDILGVFGLARLPEPPAVIEQDVDWVCGSFLLVRRECLDRVGLLDERFFTYDEDIDWCLRARRAGQVVRFWPGASMIHLGAATSPFVRDKNLIMYRSHLYYLRKNHSLLAAAAYYLAMSVVLTGGLMKHALRVLTGKGGTTEVGQRWRRVIGFALLRPGVSGI